MQLSDRITGSFVATLGVLSAYGGSRLPPVPGQDIGPSAFPIVIGIGLILCGVLITLGIGHSFEEEAEADLAAVEGPSQHAQTTKPLIYRLRALLPPGLLLFYVVAVDRLGFLPTAAVMIFVGALAFGAKLRVALPLAAIAPIAIHLIFYKLLRVPLPAGLLPMPW
ncbi:tripartite tricarboxylate transporter TctB family protein [Microvirga sp. HBU67558]|uniref:tripartite tricarboxylate transporter TctB family protein n=1 Tax=Microvirga TaxID=186650 RepID=UPI001B38046B|nr:MULTISPECIES: tripartite tricarboxylate transporter TctB family protein [unclassified Microvirga]MBQ0822066.1 tripartite tricarboxylate transporter TctB family protein [Microvirga sp. HBU67558]